MWWSFLLVRRLCVLGSGLSALSTQYSCRLLLRQEWMAHRKLKATTRQA